jgi:copper chaperone CopZ
MKQQITLKLDGMICDACAALIRDELLDTPGVNAVRVSFDQQEAVIEFDKDRVNTDSLIQHVREIGYHATLSY